MAYRRLALIVPPEMSVRQILETEREIGNPANVWHDVTDQPQVAVGWLFDGSEFREPPPPPEPPAVVSGEPTIAELHQQLTQIAARIDRLDATGAAR